jgi:DNA-binding MarR family transcriptional regulator
MTETQDAAARRVWDVMRTMVLNQDMKREVAEALGMSFFRVKALRRLAKGPMTMRRLAENLATDAPYTTLLVDDLERRGLVERTVNPGDRRSKLVITTAAGRAEAARAEEIMDRPPRQLMELDPADLAVLDRVFAGLAEPLGTPLSKPGKG